MPAKKEAVVLQKEVVNQEQWDDLIGGEGLYVVDVYQRWCGPCTAVVSLFKRLKNEIGDDLLRFAVAESDSIENLEKYRGHCEPCFLFYGGGQLVEVVRGANGPVLQRSITKQLAAEHRVLEGGSERKTIKDPLLAALEAKERSAAETDAMEKRKLEEEAQKPVPKEVTVVLIKPDAVKEGKVDEIVEKLVSNGLDVLAQEERVLSEDEAREFYKEHEEEDHFESLVQFMASGPSHILVLTKGDTGEGVVHEVRSLIGPKDVEVAKEEAPDSLRAIYGTDKTMNALHGADSAERAARELSFFFPSFAVPIVPGTGPPPMVQKTLALIRPDALKTHKDAILDKIKEAGFEVCLQKEVQITAEQAKEFYKQQEGQPHFEELIEHMTSGPVLALGLAKEEAIQNWRNMLGPKEVEVAKQEAPDSLRAQFSLPDVSINGVHGSDSIETAKNELNYFFPTEHTLAVIKPDASTEQKDAIIERIHEAGFNIACQKDIELDRELAEQLYKEHEGKDFYDSLLDHMSSGPSMVMVLSREDAIKGWRTIMGPTDPELAREQAPESLRALLGADVLHNVIHGSSTTEHAADKIRQFFPEVEMGTDGSISDMDVVHTDPNATSPTPADEEILSAQQDEIPFTGEQEVEQSTPADTDEAPSAEGAATEEQLEEQATTEEEPTQETDEGGEPQEQEGDETKVEETAEQTPAAADDERAPVETEQVEDAPASPGSQQQATEAAASDGALDDEPTSTEEQAQDAKPGGEASPEQAEAAPTEDGQQETNEGGEDKGEEPTTEGGDDKEEEPTTEGGDDKEEEPPDE